MNLLIPVHRTTKKDHVNHAEACSGSCSAQALRIHINDFVSMPSVSLIITNYNYSRYIEHAIKSVFEQDYSQIECVIVDDCSTDNSVEIIKKCLDEISDTRFRVICLRKNCGQMTAMRTGFENSTGVFVNFLDADDILRPDFVRTHVLAHLNSARSAAVSASDTIQINSDGQILEGTFHCLLKDRGVDVTGFIKPFEGINQGVVGVPCSFVPTWADDVLTFSEIDRGKLYYVDRHFDGWPVVACSSLMFRRAALEIVFPDKISIGRICADYYLYKFTHLLGGTITIPTAHSFWRFHQKNNHSTGLVLGGYYAPGDSARLKLLEADLNKAIAAHITRNIEYWEELLGKKLIGHVFKKAWFSSTSD